MPTTAFVLPTDEFTDDQGNTAYRAKYADDDRVDGYNSALIDAPPGFDGTTTPAGQVFVAALTGTQTLLDDVAADPEVWAIGTDGDLTPQAMADFLNRQFRVDTTILPEQARGPGGEVKELFDRLSATVDAPTEPLTPDEWFDRLGIDTGH